jgi:N-acetylglutamate synthase-like GNAT family acetyltransferase
MVDELSRQARRGGYTRICAFAHDPAFFVRLGFSIVPHTWVPEKIAHDCHSCPLFRNCGQYAVVLDVHRAPAAAGSAAAAAVIGRG